MATISTRNKNKTHIFNFSDDELTLKELYSKFQSLEIQQIQMLKLKEDLLMLNEKNEITSKRLLKLKTDFELYKLHLHETLYNLNLSVDHQTILTKKKLDAFCEKRKSFEEYYKLSPFNCLLEKLISENKILEEKCKNKTDLLELTEKQYNKLMSFVFQSFKKKICEFCDAVVRSKTTSN